MQKRQVEHNSQQPCKCSPLTSSAQSRAFLRLYDRFIEQLAPPNSELSSGLGGGGTIMFSIPADSSQSLK